MRRRVLLCLTLITVSACNGDKVATPSSNPPTKAISDGAHEAKIGPNNPDFFFLPPMVANPSGSANWDAGAFNASLKPTVDVCDLPAKSETDVATATCAAGTTVSYD